MATWKQKAKAIRALEKNGKVDPEELVKVAQSPNHPCHGDFTWDVQQAAKERWRDQARHLIRRVYFEVQVEETTERVVAYVPNKGDAHLFQSLPKVRTKLRAGDVLIREIAMLYGVAKRAYGIALAKQRMVEPDVVARLRTIRDTAEELKAELGG